MAVGQLQGTGQVDADMKSRTLSVVYDSEKVCAEDIQQALVGIGYESTVMD